jgi:hypothetical protein
MLDSSLAYLASDQALADLAASNYWPKWHSPWWHMLLLHELGETSRIPKGVIERFITTMNDLPIKFFPIQAHEMPADADAGRDTVPCHCQLGNVYQVLAAWGVDVDARLPWIRPWFLKYQMADGGLNCDSDAYLARGECPSSMVGTIAAFEAILFYTRRSWTAAEVAFLERGAEFLINRQLMYGSDTAHNAAERASAPDWLNLCFPRFYFYDVLRGLRALLAWSEVSKTAVPRAAVATVFQHLESRHADGVARIERQAFAGAGTIAQLADGRWNHERIPATHFPLLDAVSVVGDVSPHLSRQWAACRQSKAVLI